MSYKEISQHRGHLIWTHNFRIPHKRTPKQDHLHFLETPTKKQQGFGDGGRSILPPGLARAGLKALFLKRPIGPGVHKMGRLKTRRSSVECKLGVFGAYWGCWSSGVSCRVYPVILGSELRYLPTFEGGPLRAFRLRRPSSEDLKRDWNPTKPAESSACCQVTLSPVQCLPWMAVFIGWQSS